MTSSASSWFEASRRTTLVAGDNKTFAKALRILKNARKAWKLVKEINNASKTKIILTNTGGKGAGGTKVSPDGISFIKAFRNIEKKVFKEAINQQKYIKKIFSKNK